MGINAKKEYLREIFERYRNAGRKEKTQILDEFCKVCGYARKYAIRVLNGRPRAVTKKPGPRRRYDPDFVEVLEILWVSMRKMGSKKMVRAFPDWLPHFRLPSLRPEVKAKLMKVSPATIDRLLKPIRQRMKVKGISTTRPSTWVKSKIPIKNLDWNITRPGFMESDTVSHCGDSATGPFASSLTMTDILSTWTENRATWTKGSLYVFRQIQDIEGGLPFNILGYSADNGGEVLNERVWLYFKENNKRKDKVQVTRARPYQKNDNCYVEQKNNSHVRELFGYDRVEHPSLVDLMNDIYKNYWNPLQNFFCPSSKLIRKTRIGGKIKKEYEAPKTPYRRLLDSEHLTDEQKNKLKQRYQKLDPFRLSKELDRKLDTFFALVRKKKLRQVS